MLLFWGVGVNCVMVQHLLQLISGGVLNKFLILLLSLSCFGCCWCVVPLHGQSGESMPFLCFVPHVLSPVSMVDPIPAPQWGAADAEIKVPSVENTELKGSHFIKAWSRSVHSHTWYAYCQGRLSLLISTLQVHSPAFFSKPLPSFSYVRCD